MLQKVQIIGNLGRDPEMRYTPSGQAVTNFSVATSCSWQQDGDKKEETTWFRVSVWGKMAEVCNQYLEKGRQVFCEGRLKSEINIWQAQDGTARASYEMTAYDIKFLGRKDERPQDDNSRPFHKKDPEITEDKIPFR
jgi:single-strand DNA-binding protein